VDCYRVAAVNATECSVDLANLIVFFG